jgi:ribosomal protein S18 acetylase RimI-like enzyme
MKTSIEYSYKKKLSPEQFKQVKLLCLGEMPDLEGDVVFNDLKIDNYHVLVYDNGNLIGYIGGAIHKQVNKNSVEHFVTDYTGDKICSLIDLICVDRESQGLGIGKKLVTDFIEKAKDDVVLVGSTDHYNYRFYEKGGFHKIATWKNGSKYYAFSISQDKMIQIKKHTFKF